MPHQCPLLAHSGLFDGTRRTSTIEGEADIQRSSPRTESFSQTETLANFIFCPPPTCSASFMAFSLTCLASAAFLPPRSRQSPEPLGHQRDVRTVGYRFHDDHLRKERRRVLHRYTQHETRHTAQKTSKISI